MFHISGTVASGSGKVEAISTDTDPRLRYGYGQRDAKARRPVDVDPQAKDTFNDNDNESEDTVAKPVETKHIRQEQLEPDTGALTLMTDHERDLKSKGGKPRKRKNGKSSKKKKSRGPSVTTATKATPPVTTTPACVKFSPDNPFSGSCDTDDDCCPCKCIQSCSVILSCNYLISNSLSNFVFALCI